MIGRHQAGIDQRPQQQDEGAGMAARVGDALAAADGVALAGCQFGQAEDPARRRAVRGAGVDEAGLRVGDQRRGLARGGVGQAQEGHVGGIQQPRALGGVLAPIGLDAQHFHVAPRGQVLVDAQAGGAFLAIDKDGVRHGAPRLRCWGNAEDKGMSANCRAAAARCRACGVGHNRVMVTKKPKGLGLGLEALLGPKVSDAPPAAPGLPTSLPLDRLRHGKYQPRTRMDEGSLYELAESIRSQGVMQPILVRPVDGGYEIIAGERRFRAARLAGLDEVPVLVKPVADEAAAVMALIENIQREDLNPLEEAQGLQRLVTEFQLTHEQAAQAVGRSRSAASNLLRLLNLAEPVQQMLMAGDLDMGHARALLALGAAEQVMTAHEVVASKLSVRDTEKHVARQSAPPRPVHGQAGQAERHRAPGRTPGRPADRAGGDPRQAPHPARRAGRDRDRLRHAGRTQRPARAAGPRRRLRRRQRAADAG